MNMPKALERKPPRAGEKVWVALEEAKSIRSAIDVWRSKIVLNTKQLSGFGGGEVYWNERALFWAHFSGTPAVRSRRKRGNYWNPFGLEKKGFRGNMIVEINPPASGISTNVQGVIAIDEHKRRWVLHAGRLRRPQRPLKGEEFDKRYSGKRVPVQFSDGSTFRYHPVAMIEGDPSAVQKQTAEFVRSCAYVRNYYQNGPYEANKSRVVERAERELFPESSGSYIIPAQTAKTADRWHGRIWKALRESLDVEGMKLGNARVGSYAPDMYCTSARPPMLFEIKTAATPSDIYEGFGQLHIYEKLRGGSHKKVLVLPNRPRGRISEVLTELGVDVLTFEYKKNRAVFDRLEIKRLLSR